MSTRRKNLIAGAALVLAFCHVAIGQPSAQDDSPFFEVLRVEQVRLAEGIPIPDAAEPAKAEDLIVIWGRVPSIQPYLPRALASDQIMLDGTATRFVRHPLAGPTCALVLPRDKAGRLNTAELWRLGGDSAITGSEKKLRAAQRRAQRAGPTSSISMDTAIRKGLLQPDVTSLDNFKALRQHVNGVAEKLERELETRLAEEEKTP